MNLTYEQRMELLDIVKKEYSEQWSIVIDIDRKFKLDDNMINDKKAYWSKKQDEAYARKELLNNIKTELTLSL